MAQPTYAKYRWFFTKSGKLVYGGKSAEQNEAVINELLLEKDNFLVMHTKSPGSPFAIIRAPISKISEEDLEECAIWTACFSRAWRSGARTCVVDIFTKEQLTKGKSMPKGTFGVSGKIDHKIVELKLYLIRQKNVLRAVPVKTTKKSTKILAEVIPGKIPKEQVAQELSRKLKVETSEIEQAIPTGNFSILR